MVQRRLLKRAQPDKVEKRPTFEKENVIFGSQIVTISCTEWCYRTQERPARSVCVIVPEGGWDPCQPFHSAHHHLWADYHGAFFLFRMWRAHKRRQKESLFLTGRAGVTGHRAYTLSSTDVGPQRGAEAAVDHTNERWDRFSWMIFNVGVGGCAWRGRVGDRPCQSDCVTDRWAVGRGDRGHPRPSRPNTGFFYWVIKLLTPSPPPQETLWQMNGEILSVCKTRGQGRVEVLQRAEEDQVEVLVNLMDTMKIP